METEAKNDQGVRKTRGQVSLGHLEDAVPTSPVPTCWWGSLGGRRQVQQVLGRAHPRPPNPSRTGE